MPLTLNVGLSKKVGEPNYGSRGASVNVELELDSTLATEPDRMRERIREIFHLARSAVDEELQIEPVPVWVSFQVIRHRDCVHASCRKSTPEGREPTTPPS